MVLGASHHDLELTQLDRLTGDPDLLSRALGALAAREDSPVTGVVVVATCNRLEIYLDAVRFHDAIDEVTARRCRRPPAMHRRRGQRAAEGPGRRAGRRAPVHRRRRAWIRWWSARPRSAARSPGRSATRRWPAPRHRPSTCCSSPPPAPPSRSPPTPVSAPPAGRSPRSPWTSPAQSVDLRRRAGAGHRHRRLRPGGRRRTAGPRLRRAVGVLAQRPGRRVRRPAPVPSPHRGRRAGRRGRRRRSGRHLQWHLGRRVDSTRTCWRPPSPGATSRCRSSISPCTPTSRRRPGRCPGSGSSTCTPSPSRPTPPTSPRSRPRRTSSSPVLPRSRSGWRSGGWIRPLSRCANTSRVRWRRRWSGSGRSTPTDVAADVELALHRVTQSLLHTPTLRAKELARTGDGAGYLQALHTLFGIDITETEPAAHPTGSDSPAEHGMRLDLRRTSRPARD